MKYFLEYETKTRTWILYNGKTFCPGAVMECIYAFTEKEFDNILEIVAKIAKFKKSLKK